MSVCHEGGGPKGMERHVKVNKKVFVRERINRILDPETGLMVFCYHIFVRYLKCLKIVPRNLNY